MTNPSPNPQLLDKFMSRIVFVSDCRHCDTLKTPRQDVRYLVKKTAPPSKKQEENNEQKRDDVAEESE
jgi:hypothetical protein